MHTFFLELFNHQSKFTAVLLINYYTGIGFSFLNIYSNVHTIAYKLCNFNSRKKYSVALTIILKYIKIEYEVKVIYIIA